MHFTGVFSVRCVIKLLHTVRPKAVCAHTQVCITCTGQLLVVDTPPQPAEPPAGTLTDTLTSPPQRNESWNKHAQIQLAD